MLKQLGIVDLIAAVQEKVKANTELECYDAIPHNAPSPFYYVEFVGKRPAHTKTMYREVMSTWIHAIASPGDSKVEVYDLIQSLEEALTETVELPEGFELILQTNNGTQTIKQDETNEWHAVIQMDFMVCYGFKCKN